MLPPGADADAAHLRGEGVGEVVTVQVRRGDDVELARAREDLLERDVGDRVAHEELLLPLAAAVRRPDGERRLNVASHFRLPVGRHQVVARVDLARVVLDGDRGPGLPVAEDPALALGDDPVTVVPHGERVAPVAERALGELHDVALVDEGDAPALVAERVVDRGAGETLGALARHGLHADAAGGREADLLDPQVALQERDQLPRLGALYRPLDAGVDVFGVLAEDDYIDLLWPLHRARHAREVAHRAEADVEVEHLAESDVERADAAADRRGEWALDADHELLEGGDRVLGEPVLEAVEGLLAGVDLHPGDPALAAVGLVHGGVEDRLAGAPDVGTGAVALDEGEDGVGGDVEAAVGAGLDAVAGGDGDGGVRGHEGSIGSSSASRSRCEDRRRRCAPHRAARDRSARWCDRGAPPAPSRAPGSRVRRPAGWRARRADARPCRRPPCGRWSATPPGGRRARPAPCRTRRTRRPTAACASGRP